MKINEVFPSKYLKASDLQDREIAVTMAHVELDKLGDDTRPVLYFKGKEKGLVLNKTNANNIASRYGDDTDEWFGHQIILYPAMVDFQGKTTEAIRVRVPKGQPQPQRERIVAESPQAPPPPARDDFEDRDVPF